MSDGATHAKIAAGMLFPLTGVAIWSFQQSPQFAIGVGAGALAGLLLTPDIDQEQATHEEIRMRRVPVWGWAWQWAWTGYALGFKHRGISHVLIVGTITRAVYALALAIMMRFTANGLWLDLCMGQVISCTSPWIPQLDTFFVSVPLFWGGLFFGWMCQDAGHIIVDYVGLRTLAGLALLTCITALLAYIFLWQ